MDHCGFFIKIITKKITNLGLREMILVLFCFHMFGVFFFYAFLSASFVVMWGQGFWLGLPIAIGIGLYGLAYFIVHDVFIHQRFKFLRNIDNKYARGVRRAHKIHHKNINKDGGECFGMLIVPWKYFK